MLGLETGWKFDLGAAVITFSMRTRARGPERVPVFRRSTVSGVRGRCDHEVAVTVHKRASWVSDWDRVAAGALSWHIPGPNRLGAVTCRLCVDAM